MVAQLGSDYRLARFEYVIGKRLKPNEKSSTGIYGLISRDKQFALRAALDQQISEIHSDDSRYTAELFLLSGDLM